MRYCPNCGNKVENANFCQNCGCNVKFLLNVHPDLQNLLWFGDGPRKNYIKEKRVNESIKVNGYTIYFSTYGSEEPSLLLTKLPISKPVNVLNVPRPPYYPSYADLTPEQRWMYWQFLENPYSGSHDIGYVFIFYYGLERYLFSQHSKNAVNVILKLRDCYANTSFQSYSSTALILYAISKKDTSLATSFLDSIDKSYEMKIPADLLVLLKYTLSLPLTAYEIMCYSKNFLFSNQRYIKNNPDVFLGFLQQEIKVRYGSDFVHLGLFFDNADVRKIKATDIPLFANISIRDKIVRIPCLCEYGPFTAEINNLLTAAHESTKKYLAEQRKVSKTNTKVQETPLTDSKISTEKASIPIAMLEEKAVCMARTSYILPCEIEQDILDGVSYSKCKKKLSSKRGFDTLDSKELENMIWNAGSRLLTEKNAKELEKNYQYYKIQPISEESCPICTEKSKELFEFKNRKVGINFPPLHDGCKCTILTVIPDYDNRIEDYEKQHSESNTVYQEYSESTYYSRTILMCTIFGGWFGLHRYMRKQIGMGLLYTFTAGLFCIGWIVDIVVEATRDKL